MSINNYVSLYKRKVNLKCFWVSGQSRGEIGGGNGRQKISFYRLVPVCL
jgi:hypothetical protein